MIAQYSNIISSFVKQTIAPTCKNSYKQNNYKQKITKIPKNKTKEAEKKTTTATNIVDKYIYIIIRHDRNK